MVALRNLIGEKVGKGVEVSAEAGRSTSFEVTVNGNLLFSKLEEKNFPDNDDVCAAIAEYIKDKKVRKAKKKS